MKINLFTKIFVSIFSTFFIVLSLYIYELRASQESAVINNMEVRAKSMSDTITFVNSDNMILDDEVRIFEFIFNFVKDNRDLETIVLSRLHGDELIVKKESWKIIEKKDREDKKNLATGIVFSSYTNKNIFRYKYDVVFSSIKWGELV